MTAATDLVLSAPRAGRKLQGRTEARLFTPPLRPLTRETTRGYEVIEFAEMIGEPLLPWQKWAVLHALELNPDGTYRFRTVLILVARQNGKSSLKRTVSLWRMYMDGAKNILGVAQNFSMAKEQMDLCKESIHNCPELQEEWEQEFRGAGNEHFRAAGCRYIVKATTKSAARGLSIDELNFDELREQRSWDAWSAISKTTMARINAQTWCMSNAGDDDSVVLNQLRDAALAGTDESLCLLEWSAPDRCELDDPDGWEMANPGLGHTISESAIRSAMGTDPPASFRTEVLCQRVDHLDGAVDTAAWKACADPTGTMDGLRDRLAACFDISPDGQHATLAVAGVLDDGRIRVELAMSWKSTEEARNQLPALLDAIKPVSVAWYPMGPGASFAPLMREQNGSNELTGGKVIEACQGLADLVTSRKILHASEPLLDSHIGAAQKLPSGDGWRFTRRGGAGHVDSAYAVAGAVYAAQTMPVVVMPSIRVMSY